MTEPGRTESGEVGTSGLLLRGGRVVDPASGLDDRVDVLLSLIHISEPTRPY